MNHLTREDVEHRLFSLFRDIDWWRHDAVGAAFAEDGVFSLAASREDFEQGHVLVTQGREQVADFLRSSFTNLAQTHHMISNLMVTLDGDRAEAEMHMRAYHKGKGRVAHLFEESLALVSAKFRAIGGRTLIERMDYSIMVVLGSMDVFTDVDLGRTT